MPVSASRPPSWTSPYNGGPATTAASSAPIRSDVILARSQASPGGTELGTEHGAPRVPVDRDPVEPDDGQPELQHRGGFRARAGALDGQRVDLAERVEERLRALQPLVRPHDGE